MDRPRVLLVDDNEAGLQLLSYGLRREFSVWIARNARHAVEIATELDWDADAIVTDLNLGDGMRGDEFAAYYRGLQKRRAVIVLITGATDIAPPHPKSDLDEIVLKPVNIDGLISLLWKLIFVRRQAT